MPSNPKYLPGTSVKIMKGSFAGGIGTVLDQLNDKDGRGHPLPPTRPGFYWIMLTLGAHPFAAHLHEAEFELNPGISPA
jgi:hypothetical protein